MARRCVRFFALQLVILTVGCSTSTKPVRVHRPSEPTAPATTIATIAPLTSVNANDLGHSVSVIGPLGEPLGKRLRIEGRFVADKDKTTYWDVMIATNLFSVEKINGRKLPNPAWIELRNLSNTADLKAVEYAVFEGYQDGGFVGTPSEADGAPVQIPWHFSAVFRVLKVHE